MATEQHFGVTYHDDDASRVIVERITQGVPGTMKVECLSYGELFRIRGCVNTASGTKYWIRDYEDDSFTSEDIDDLVSDLASSFSALQ